jgi:O-antigen/teichoic acid export membrane protein
MTGDEAVSNPAKPSVRSGVITALPVAIAGLVANGANIIVTILLARLLSNQAYGAFAQLVGLFLVVSMPGSAVIVAVVRRTASWRASGSHAALAIWAARMHRRMAWILGAYVLLVVAASIPVAAVLAKPSPLAVGAMLVGAGLWVSLCIDRGFLQGTRSYRPLANNLLTEGAVRTVVVLGLAVAFKLPGAAFGVLLAEVATAIHARLAAHRALKEATDDGLSLTPPSVRRDLVVDLIAALMGLALIAVLQNVDVIVLGRLNPSEAGSYAAVSVACKALVFAAIVLGGYLLPEAAISYHEGVHALRQLAATLSMLAVPALALILIAELFPDQVLRLVFSARYLGAEAAFAPLALAMTALSISVVLTMYLLAHGRHWVVILLGIGVVAASLSIGAAHGSPVETAHADLIVQSVLMVACAAGLMIAHVRAHGIEPPSLLERDLPE